MIAEKDIDLLLEFAEPHELTALRNLCVRVLRSNQQVVRQDPRFREAVSTILRTVADTRRGERT